ncbi:MAG: response regulator transcription factor [Bifidobacteriaceae bacterium]|jgi:DNA-binding NarL/FixJ family response regulator|nr:response regulator transcription factor [Bifidobacteriaceae bacterium]
MTQPIRVVLADDQAMIRDGLSVLLASSGEIEVVGQAADGAEAIAVTAATKPDVVLMDIRMPGMDGIEATGAIVQTQTRTGSPDSQDGQPQGPRVLILTTFDHDDYIYDALTAGASGFMLKDASARDLIEAVKIIARGDGLLAPSVTRRLLADFAGRRRAGRGANPNAAAALTPRERDVMREVARGLTNLEIAQSLFLSEQTVKTHVAHILDKLGLRDRTQVVVFAYENDLVER